MRNTKEMNKQQQVDWRRDKVLELSSRGHSFREIASTLQICPATVFRDMEVMRLQARQNIGKYIDEQLPAEYHKCLVGITAIMKEAWNTAAKAEQDGDIRDKLAALQLAQSCYSMKLDLLSSATVIDRAVKFVDRYRGSMPQNMEVSIDSANDITESQ